MKIYNYFYLIIFLLKVPASFSQGFNHTWLLGYNVALDSFTISPKSELLFDSNNVSVVPQSRKMPFLSTQANISDKNGNLLMASNGCWIANALGDTLLNGSGLNPGPITQNWCDAITGLPIPHGNIVIPYPGDSNKLILFHQTAHNNYHSYELFYTVIDLTLDSGRGEVILKNQIVFQHKISLGITACKHANGRDWWIVALKDSSNIIYKVLVTSNGISSVTQQTLNVPIAIDNEGQPTFSPDGSKFAYSDYIYGPYSFHDVRLFDFDRCTGMFSDTTYIPFNDSLAGIGLAFSPDSKFLYCSSWQRIYQVNTDSLSVITVAINDGYYSPFFPLQSDFWMMYLAANGKIYVSSGNSVIDLHYINFPDSAGPACDVHQHDLHLPCYSGRGNVNHPNYYLGPVIGSTCDSLVHVGMNENSEHNFHFSITPNPASSSIKIVYLLPQNKSGWFQVLDMMGRLLVKMPLPPWSSLQEINLPGLVDGVYNAVIASSGKNACKKFVVLKN